MNFIDKIIMRIFVLTGSYFFSELKVECDGDDNVIKITFWK